MNKLLIFLLLLPEILFCQKFDNVWPGGLNEFPGTSGSGNYVIRFDNNIPTIDSVDLQMNFESTVAALSDSAGNLFLYTNGCEIFNAKLGFPIPGPGNGLLNRGAIHDSVCPKIGYIVPRGAMFLPVPGYENQSKVLLHMAAHAGENGAIDLGPLYVTYISVINNLYAEIIEKNQKLLDTNLVNNPLLRKYEPFSVVRHGNGRDWWIVTPQYETAAYHTFLLSKEKGFVKLPVQVIGPKMSCPQFGSSVFSPDGSQFARTQNCGVLVMNFNRCTGKFAQPKLIERPPFTFGGGGAVFSHDNSTLIVTSQLAILSANLNDAVPKFDTLIDFTVIAGNSLHYPQIGPDNKIYISSLQSTKSLLVLDMPFDTNPQFGKLPLPVVNARSIPNFPNFRLYDFANSPCDTIGINTPIAISEPIADESLVIYPNPATNKLTIQLPVTNRFEKHQVSFKNILGQTLKTLSFFGNQIEIDVSDLPNGLVYIQIFDNGKIRAVEKVVIAH